MNDHVDQIMAVMTAAFDPKWGEAWNRSQVTSALLLPTTHYELIEEPEPDSSKERGAAGFVLIRAAPGEEEILLIAVRPEFRNRGLGRKLLTLSQEKARERGATKIFLEMREGNTSEHLYTSFGFEVIGRRKSYYKTSDGTTIDAITLVKYT